MPKRIKDYSTTATSYASDDYLAMDGATNGTRKILAYTVGVYPWSMNSSGVLSSTTVNTPLIQLKPALTTTECGLEWLDSTSTRAGYVKYTTNSADLLIDSGKSGGSGKIVFYTNETDCGRFTSARNFTIGVTSSETGLTGAGGCIVGSTTLGTSTTTGALVVGGTIAGNKKAFIKDGLRLEQTATTVYSDVTPLSNGYVEISGTASGTANLGRITSTIVNNTAVSSRARQGGLAFDGVTTTAQDLHTIADLGTSDWSFRVVFLCHTSTSGSQGLIGFCSSSSSALASTSAMYVYFYNGSLLVERTGSASTSNFKNVSIASFTTTYGGKIVDLTVTQTAGTIAVYVNGVAQTVSTGGGGTQPAWNDSLTTTYAMVGRLSTAYLFPSTIYSAQLYNRALSASEVVDLANKGVAEADKWASLTAKIGGTTQNGNFEAGAGTTFTSWSAGSSITVAEETVDMHSGTRCPKITGAGTPGLSAFNWFACNTITSGPLLTAKRYKYSVWLKRVSGTDAGYIANGFTTLQTVTNAGSWLEYTGEFTTSTDSTLRDTIFNFASASGSVWLIDDVTVTEIGCLLDADLAVGVGYQAPDRSSNKYHGVISSTGVSWTLPVRWGTLRTTTNTSGNQQMLGATAIPTNAIIRNIVGYTTGTPTVQVGNASGGSQLVASVPMSASTYTNFTLAAIVSSTGNIWVNSSTADTINWTIYYIMADP